MLDALSELDGRVRSAHSGVDHEDAVRVRDLLSGAAGVAATVVATRRAASPRRRMNRSRPSWRRQSATERPAYMPLFVAPQPIAGPATRVDDGIRHLTTPIWPRADDDDDRATARPTGGVVAAVEVVAADAANRRIRRAAKPTTNRQRGAPANPRRRRRFGRRRDADAGDDENGSGEAGTTPPAAPAPQVGSGDDNDEGPSPDDPPNTVVHERAPRAGKSGSGGGSSNAEIKGIDGSTRLEAKRQRRRDGRDAGRRRPPVLTEAEFLARREAVERVMVVRDRVRTEPRTRVRGTPRSRCSRTASSSSTSSPRRLPRPWWATSTSGSCRTCCRRWRRPSSTSGAAATACSTPAKSIGRPPVGRGQRKIEKALKPGDYVVVQVSKDPVGHKGARLTTQVSLAGRYLVYVPGASSTGISRKLPDTERQRLKEILRDVVPSDAGVIIRTASEGVKEEDIRKDVTRLQERWNRSRPRRDETKQKAAGAAVALYEEPDVLVKVIRDLFNEDFAGLIVSGDEAWNTINEYVNSVAPELVSKLTKYEPAGARMSRPDQMCSRCIASTSSWPRRWTARCGCRRAAR